jgi:hypothetical protein
VRPALGALAGSLSIVEKDAAPVVSFAAMIERLDDPGATSVSQRAIERAARTRWV